MKPTPLLLNVLAATACAVSSAHAGTGYVTYAGKSTVSQTPPMNVPSLCECFEANSASFSVYAAGLIPSNDKGELDGSFGAGISMDYFFTQYIGLEGDATWFAEDSAVHLFTGSVVLRAPIKDLCLAPYVLAGGGIHANGVTQGVAHLGGGVDFRMVNCIGLFADARYTWADDTSNYTTIRGGVRFAF